MDNVKSYTVEDFVAALQAGRNDKDKIMEIFQYFVEKNDPEWVNGYKPVLLGYKYRAAWSINQILNLDYVVVNDEFNNYQNTPLHWAILYSHPSGLDNVTDLLKKGPDMTRKNSLHQNAFDIALSEKNLPALNLLIDYIDKYNNVDKHTYFKLLFDLITGNYDELTQKLLTHCINIDINTSEDLNFLELAIKKKKLSVVKCLLDRGADVNYVDKLDKYASTALHTAIVIEDLKIVKLLLDYGASFDIPSADECGLLVYPIHYAVDQDCLEIVKEFLARGEDVNRKNIYDRNQIPLHYACYFDNINIAKLLIERGGDLSAEGIIDILFKYVYDGSTFEIFTYILSLNHFELSEHQIGIIVSYCASSDFSNQLEQLFDYLHTRYNNKFLRKLNVDVFNNPNIEGQLIHKASKYDYENCIDLLVDNGVDVNLINYEGRTALHSAFVNKNLESIVSLIQNGADINVKRSQGFLPVNDPADPSRLVEEETFANIINYYGYHIIKLKYLKRFVDDINYDFAVKHLGDPFKYYEKYESEIVKMKKTMIGGEQSITNFYHFISGSLGHRINILKNLSSFNTLSNMENYSAIFPEFAHIISGLFQQARARKDLEEKFFDVFGNNDLSRYLPDLMVEKIISYLNNSDLRSIIYHLTID